MTDLPDLHPELGLPAAAELRACEACRLKGRGEPVPGEAWGDCAVMLIGEAPGPVEAKTGRPFVGESGRRLRRLLAEAGIKDFYLTNTVRHQPMDISCKHCGILKEDAKRYTEVGQEAQEQTSGSGVPPAVEKLPAVSPPVVSKVAIQPPKESEIALSLRGSVDETNQPEEGAASSEGGNPSSSEGGQGQLSVHLGQHEVGADTQIRNDVENAPPSGALGAGSSQERKQAGQPDRKPRTGSAQSSPRKRAVPPLPKLLPNQIGCKHSWVTKHKNRVPKDDELEACLPFLAREIAVIQPKVIVLIGETAMCLAFKAKGKVKKFTGRWGTMVDIPTAGMIHPAAIGRMTQKDRGAWEGACLSILAQARRKAEGWELPDVPWTDAQGAPVPLASALDIEATSRDARDADMVLAAAYDGEVARVYKQPSDVTFSRASACPISSAATGVFCTTHGAQAPLLKVGDSCPPRLVGALCNTHVETVAPTAPDGASQVDEALTPATPPPGFGAPEVASDTQVGGPASDMCSPTPPTSAGTTESGQEQLPPPSTEVRGSGQIEPLSSTNHPHQSSPLSNQGSCPYCTTMLSSCQKNKAHLILHNSAYDATLLMRHGVLDAREMDLEDTMVLAHVMGLTDLSLKGLSAKLLDEPMPAFEELFGDDAAAADQKALAGYCARDAVQTLKLFSRLHDIARPEDVKVYEDIERPLLPIFAEMTAFGGFELDQDGIQAELKTTTNQMEKLDFVFRSLVGEPTINIKSGDQVAAVLKDKLGLPLTKLVPKKDRVAVGAAVLRGIGAHHPCVGVLLQYRVLEKRKSTYLLKWSKRKRLTAVWHQTGTRTGRSSSSGPNLQNIPNNLRKYLTARPGKKFIAADYCLAPGTRVLRTDLRWVDIATLDVGENLVGLDEDREPRMKRRMRPTRVVAKRTRRLPCVRISMEDGRSIVATVQHPWLARRRRSHRDGRYEWRQSSWLRPGDEVWRLAEPWDEPQSYAWGYLGGILDGEGHLRGGRGPLLDIAQNPGSVLDAVVAHLTAESIPFRVTHPGPRAVRHVAITGIPNILRVLGQARPRRLLEKGQRAWRGRVPERGGGPVRVTHVEPIGEQTVISLQTDGHTFVAEGFFTHNSQVEYRVAAHLSQDPAMIQAYLDGRDMHDETARMIWPDAEEITSEMRRRAKILNFGGILFGGSPDKMLEEAQRYNYPLTYKEAEDAIHQAQRERPTYYAWAAETAHKGLTDQYIDGLYGHRFYLAEGLSYQELNKLGRQAVNYPIQGGARDIVKIGMAKAWSVLLMPIVADNHDELIFEVDEGEADEFALALKPILEYNNPLDVPLLVDIRVGWRWKE